MQTKLLEKSQTPVPLKVLAQRCAAAQRGGTAALVAVAPGERWACPVSEK